MSKCFDVRTAKSMMDCIRFNQHRFVDQRPHAESRRVYEAKTIRLLQNGSVQPLGYSKQRTSPVDQLMGGDCIA